MGNLDLIVTNSKPYGIIKGKLRKWKKIGIISCNSCARACETGGREKMEELAERLKKDGFNYFRMRFRRFHISNVISREEDNTWSKYYRYWSTRWRRKHLSNEANLIEDVFSPFFTSACCPIFSISNLLYLGNNMK
jgi:hypothetical protein